MRVSWLVNEYGDDVVSGLQIVCDIVDINALVVCVTSRRTPSDLFAVDEQPVTSIGRNSDHCLLRRHIDLETSAESDVLLSQ